VLDEVASSRRAVIVTKRGKPVAKLVPLERADVKSNALAGSVIHEDDLISPSHEVWNGG
jgi:antitoxin (DNA-binding transcriptional repressor) of toxin-antitoxin stability system